MTETKLASDRWLRHLHRLGYVTTAIVAAQLLFIAYMVGSEWWRQHQIDAAQRENTRTHIGALARLIAPAVKAVPKTAPDRLDAAVVENARRSASLLLADSRPLRERVRAGRLKVVSARYGLEDGKVSGLKDA